MIPTPLPRLPIASAVVAATVLFGACGGSADEPGTPPDTTRAAATTPDSASAGPGLGALVGDIRAGIAGIPGLVGDAPDSARQTAIRLYVTRQEVIEARWGPRAPEAPDSLAAAVAEAEARHHRLMEVLGESPPDSVAVAEAVDALDAQLAVVSRRGTAEGVE